MPDTYMVQFKGRGSYQGYDPGSDRYIAVKPGEIIAVSAEKRRQLVEDFPSDWDVMGETEPVNAETVAQNVVETTSEVPQRTRRPSRRKPHDPEQEK